MDPLIEGLEKVNPVKNELTCKCGRRHFRLPDTEMQTVRIDSIRKQRECDRGKKPQTVFSNSSSHLEPNANSLGTIGHPERSEGSP